MIPRYLVKALKYGKIAGYRKKQKRRGKTSFYNAWIQWYIVGANPFSSKEGRIK